MHRPLFGHSFAVLVAPILLSVLAFNFLNRKKAGVRKDVEDADTGASGSSTPPTGTDSRGSSPCPTAPTGNSYDVFLSFRGPDTRDGFAGHLYSRLHFAKIHSFRDDEELPHGEKIGPDLLAAIKNSKILIPILSENYGSSSWCLDELVQIMECKNSNTGYIVLPIFYKVAPADVRHQTGKFGKAFRKRERSSLARDVDPTIVKKWKKALEEVGNLRGREVKGSEAASIDWVVEQVLPELKKKFELVIPENLVGIESHVEKVMEVVNNNSGAALFVVIHGMGGIGKTTLAKKIYNELSNRFKYHCFIPDVRESCKRNGIEHLQNQLISVILERDHKVATRDEGIKFLASKVNNKKVLILLDDVDKDDDLKALAGNQSWFSSGSIFIITTRNMSIIDKARGDFPYELEGMGRNNSTILFSRHAFRMDSPPSEFKELTDEVVSTTGGLPLALEILGSFLCGAERKIWTSTIKKLQKIPDEEVQEKLKISYDALSPGQKQIFLDIACFFIGADERIASHASYMWDACEFGAIGIEVLRLRSLIKVGSNHKLIMHDQLKDLGRWIVREGTMNKPQCCSRLWDSEEALEVLKEKKGTSKIEALRLDNWPEDYWFEDEAEDDWGKSYTAEQLKELTNLRFLDVTGANFTGDFRYLFPELRWLCWKFYSSDFQATNFHPKKLVVLDLSETKISKDWGGWDPLKMATELKVLDLSHCHSLTTTPDLSAFKNLEILILEGCGRLKEIHPSLGAIKTLVSLNVRSCSKLKELPEWISSQNKLETLDASYCRRLARIPSSIDHLPSLSLLNLSHCKELAPLPDSIGDLPSLSLLDLRYCDKLAQLPNSIGHLQSLSHLNLSYCKELAQLPDSIGHLSSLSHLDLSLCYKLAQLPDSIGHLPSLSLLDLSHCDKLGQLPDSIGSLMSLQRLLLSNCRSLREIPDSIGKLTSLTELDLRCSAIVELPDSIWNMQNLSILDISGTLLGTCLFEYNSIRILANIQKWRALGCKNLEGLPGELVLLNMLPPLHNASIPCYQELPSCLLARASQDSSYQQLSHGPPNSKF